MIPSKKFNLAFAIAGLCAAGGGAQLVYAQTDALVLEEVVVTASKRGDVSAQETALSISVASDDLIVKSGMVGMDDFLRTVPSVNFLDRGAGRNGLVVRGVSASPQTDVTTGVYIDEATVTGLGSYFGGNPDLKYVDMQRVEVLRGPQGTLYGDGSMAGTVRAITNKPDLTAFSAEIVGEYSSTANKGDDNTMLQGVLNMPVIKDTLAIRVVAYDYDNSGFYENVAGSNPDKQIWAGAFGGVTTDSEDVGSDQYTGGRISVLWQPTDNLTANLIHIQQDIEQSGIPESLMVLGETRRAPFQRQTGAGEALTMDLDLTNLEINWDLGSFVLTSSTSVAETEELQDRDVGMYFGPLLGVDDIPLYLADSGGVDSFAQELRLNTQFDGRWQFLIGAFYQDLERTLGQDFVFEGQPELDPFGGLLLFESTLVETVEQIAFFGEVTFDLTDSLSAVAGIRRYDFDQSAKDQNDGLFNGGFTSNSLSSDDSGNTYKLGLTYTPSDDTTVYGTFAQGFRLGGPHPLIPPEVCDFDGDGLIDGVGVPIPDTIASDELDSFEIGAKFVLANGRATLNVAAYQVEWEGIPVAQVADCGFELTLNAGEAESRGVEIEGQVLMSDIWSMNYGLSYVSAELTDQAPGLGESGDRLPGSPEFQMSVGLQADFDLMGRPTYLRTDVTHIGEYFNNLQEAGPEAGDYTTINLRAGINVTEKISLSVFARNLTNEDGLTWIETELGDGRANYLRPRTIGIQLRAMLGQ